ncbi:MAG TPA: hypothetical protein VH591_17055 [Ktedonobacterales bacterium]|jgi:hypothetical protein
MTAQPVARAGDIGAWRWGLLFGIIQVVLLNGASLLLGYSFPGAGELVSNLVNIVLFGMGLFLCGCAGYIAARKSGNPYTGNSAGLYAGLVYITISLTLGLLLLFSTAETFRDLVARHPILVAVASGCTIVIYGLLALVAGVIGGKLAQRSMAKA